MKEILKDGRIVKLEFDYMDEKGKYNPYITLPDELIIDMEWQEDDDIEVSTTDKGEISSIVLRNLSKEQRKD